MEVIVKLSICNFIGGPSISPGRETNVNGNLRMTILLFIFQLREYLCNIAHDIFFDIPRIFKKINAFSAGKRHVL